MEIGDGVIEIITYTGKINLWRPFLKPLQEKTKSTGILLGKKLVLTNYHVVKYNVRLKCRLPEQENLINLKLLSFMMERDLALCEIQSAVDLPYLEFCEHFPHLNEPVFAVGYPLGHDELKVTDGIVSGFEEKETNTAWVPDSERTFLIETTCPINPGNSGGALVDAKNRVVGLINSGILQARGVGFAIPSPIILHELPKLLRGSGRVYPYPWGLQIQSIPPILKGKLTGGYIVDKLHCCTMDVQCGDIIIGINDQKVVSHEMLSQMPIKAYIQSKPLESITVMRNSKKIQIPYTDTIKLSKIRYTDPQLEGLEYKIVMGICICSLTINHVRDAIKDGNYDFAEYLKPKNMNKCKYIITYIFPNSPANDLDVEVLGDLITTINDKPPEQVLNSPFSDKFLKIITEKPRMIYLPVSITVDRELMEDYNLPKNNFILLK